MRQIGDVLAGAGTERVAAPVATRPGSAVAMPQAEAERILAAPLSAEMVDAMRSARLAQEPGIYTASDGSTHRMPPPPVRATPEAVREAAGRLVALQTIMAVPADPRTVMRWLMSLAALTERAPTGDALIAEVRVLAENLTHPAVAFTAGTAREVARRLVWWPKWAKLDAALTEIMAETRREEGLLAAIAVPPPPPRPALAPPPRPSPEERAAMARRAAEFAAEVAERDRRRPVVGRPPRPLTPEQVALMRQQLREKRGAGA